MWTRSTVVATIDSIDQSWLYANDRIWTKSLKSKLRVKTDMYNRKTKHWINVGQLISWPKVSCCRHCSCASADASQAQTKNKRIFHEWACVSPSHVQFHWCINLTTFCYQQSNTQQSVIQTSYRHTTSLPFKRTQNLKLIKRVERAKFRKSTNQNNCKKLAGHFRSLWMTI